MVVFAPDYRAAETGGAGQKAESDLVCSWRYGNSVAEQYGGDVEQPVTLVGWAVGGADMALELGLRGDGNSEEQCFTAAPDPGAVVAINPCMNRVTGFDPTGWSNKNARVVLIAGKSGACSKSGAEYGAEQLQSAGFDATMTIINSANHFNVVFHQTHEAYLSSGARDADFATAYDPGNAVGMQVARMVLEAVGAGTSNAGHGQDG